MSCGGFVQSIGAPPVVRRSTFYSACLPIRAAIGFALFKYGRIDPDLVAWTMLALSLFAMAVTLSKDAQERKDIVIEAQDGGEENQHKKKECRVWWSRRVHALFAGFLAFTSVMIMYRIFNSDMLALVWMLDVTFGLVSSFFWATF